MEYQQYMEVGHLYRHGGRPVKDYIQTYRFILTHHLPVQFYRTGFLECGINNKIWKFDPNGMSDHDEPYMAYEIDPSILKPAQKYGLIKAIFGTWGI